jgi:uncharacterized damage-inducible protein DinB
MSNYGATELAKAFRTVRGNTIHIARDIPEDKYDFRPVPGARSVNELFRHIIYSPLFQEDVHRTRRATTFKGYDFGASLALVHAAADKPKSKAEILDALEREGERVATWLESLTPAYLAETVTDPNGANPRTRLELLMAIKEHEMHHRGQLMLIERLVGVVPHLTREREERNRARTAAAPTAR